MHLDKQGELRKQPQTKKVGLEYLAVLIMAAIYTLVTSRYLINAHENFYTFHNMAEFENWYWQFLHGNPFTTSLPKPSPHLYIGQLVLMPFYALWTDARTLLIGRSIWIAIGVLPVYLLSKSVLKSKAASILAVLCYCLNPIIIMTHFNQYFSAEPFAIPVFLLALYAAIDEKPIILSFSLAFACLIREDMALIVVAIGAFVWLSKKHRSLGIAIILGALAYFFISVFLVIPKIFNLAEYVPSGGFGYDYLGEDIRGIITGALKHPHRILETVMTAERGKYLALLLLSVAFFPLAALDVLLCGLPALLINLISKNPEQVDPYSVYAAPVIPFVIGAAIVGVERISRRVRRPNRLLILLLALVASLDLLMILLSSIPANNLPEMHRNASQRAVAYVPKDASITATPNFLPHLSQRPCLFDLSQEQKSEYYLIETNPGHWITQWLQQSRNALKQKRIEEIMANPQNELVLEEDGIYLYRNTKNISQCR